MQNHGVAAKLDIFNPPTQAAIEFFEHLLRRYGPRDFDVRFWDGTTWATESPRFTLVLTHAESMRAMFDSPSELSLGEAYVRGDFDVEGDMEAALAMGHFLLNDERSAFENIRLASLLRTFPAADHGSVSPGPRLLGWRHSKYRDRQAIHYHYDLPPSFYQLWLDSRMVYSCAYFNTSHDNLETAQEQKLDHICRKLRLKPGERLLDIGCGWGGLILHAAKRYGVRALGITLSESQASVARERIATAGLEAQCEVELRDYREVQQDEGFDKIVSVGMFEHVGRSRFDEYFAKAKQLLKPGGVFLNHAIAYSAKYVRKGPSFIDRYVFPDGDLVPINIALHAAEEAGFEVRDLESLREHYALTLRQWVRRLEQHATKAREITNDATYRIWRLYMAGSAYAFRIGRLSVFQTLLSRPENGDAHLPLTRDDWYCPENS